MSTKEKDMIGPITRALVGVPLHRQGILLDVVQRLGNTSTDGDGWCSLFGAVIQEGLSQKKETILEFVGTVIVFATIAKFVARDQFVFGVSGKTRVRIDFLDGNLQEWFLLGKGKIEDPITGKTLCYHKLRNYSTDGPIIAERGGEAKVETTLTEVYDLMAKQPNGTEGVLLTNGWQNIFYVRDFNGVLRTVCVHWHNGGWYVFAYFVDSPNGCHYGCQVFSHDS